MPRERQMSQPSSERVRVRNCEHINLTVVSRKGMVLVFKEDTTGA